MASRPPADRGLARRVFSLAMTSEEAARENLSCAQNAPSEAWAVVMYFYAAVHAVNHHSFGAKLVPGAFKHWERNQYVMQNLPAVDRAYRALSSLAHDARYSRSSLPADAPERLVAFAGHTFGRSANSMSQRRGGIPRPLLDLPESPRDVSS
jgi:hypothetical protein